MELLPVTSTVPAWTLCLKGNRQTSEGYIELPSSLQLSLFVLI